jgi:DNA-binding LytR/AlgR family response regulator
MHVAVCDDNVADRKQFERLIKRESDKRMKDTGVIFSSCFGNTASLLNNPLQYDIFYIDMCKTPGVNVGQLVETLREKGVNAPIVLCCSDIDYRTLSLSGDISYLDKPIRAEELSSTIDYALEKKAHAEHLIELREDTKTYHVTEPEILYALQEGSLVNVYLTDGRVIRTMDSALNLFDQVEVFPTFLVPTVKVLLNGRHIRAFKFNRAIMDDGKKFKISRDCMPYAKEIYEKYVLNGQP